MVLAGAWRAGQHLGIVDGHMLTGVAEGEGRAAPREELAGRLREQFHFRLCVPVVLVAQAAVKMIILLS